MPGMEAIKIAQDGPLKPLVDAVVARCRYVGRRLRERGWEDLYDAATNGGAITNASAAAHVAHLVRALPDVLDDTVAIDVSQVAAGATANAAADGNGQGEQPSAPDAVAKIPLYATAEAMVAALCDELHADAGEAATGAMDSASMACFADAHLPAILVAEGIVQVRDSALRDAVKAGTPIGGTRGEAELRVAAIVACDEIAATLRADPRFADAAPNTVHAVAVERLLRSRQRDAVAEPAPGHVTLAAAFEVGPRAKPAY
jgi:hypothetical protein